MNAAQRRRSAKAPAAVVAVHWWRRMTLAGWLLCVLVAVGYASVLTWAPATVCT